MKNAFSAFPLIKLSATGNDFLLVDLLDSKSRALWKKDWGKSNRSQLAQRWCDRFDGLGADGILWIEPDKQSDFVWDFYNSDGSHAEMCGNAARAVSLYYSLTKKKKKLRFSTAVGVVAATVFSAKKIEVIMPKIQEQRWAQTTTWKDQKIQYDFVRAGVPHVVVRVPHLEDLAALRELAEKIRLEKPFLAEGTNVTFVHWVSPTEVESITFERGVDDFTLSCGTGALASAHSMLRGESGTEITIQVPGGTLFAEWKQGAPHLRGPAKIVAKMFASQGA